LRECPKDELQWRKKEFIADLTRVRKTGDILQLLQPSAFRKLLRRAAAMPAAQLPAPRKAATIPIKESAARVSNSDAGVVTRKVLSRAPLREKSETELTEDLCRQKQALRDRGWLPEPEELQATAISA